jgi:hypothetical protein
MMRYLVSFCQREFEVAQSGQRVGIVDNHVEHLPDAHVAVSRVLRVSACIATAYASSCDA